MIPVSTFILCEEMISFAKVILCICVCAWMYLCVSCAYRCPWRPEGSDSPGAGVPGGCKQEMMWVLSTEPGTYETAVSALNFWAISPAP